MISHGDPGAMEDEDGSSHGTLGAASSYVEGMVLAGMASADDAPTHERRLERWVRIRRAELTRGSG